MDDTTSESNWDKIGTSLFDWRLFADTLANFQAATENQIHESEERWRQLKKEIELLPDLKQTLCSGLQSSSTSDSSRLFKKGHFLSQESSTVANRVKSGDRPVRTTHLQHQAPGVSLILACSYLFLLMGI